MMNSAYVRERQVDVRECGRPSIIPEINSFPRFPLNPRVSEHTATALSIWNSAKNTWTHDVCMTFKVSAGAQQGKLSVCENSVSR